MFTRTNNNRFYEKIEEYEQLKRSLKKMWIIAKINNQSFELLNEMMKN